MFKWTLPERLTIPRGTKPKRLTWPAGLWKSPPMDAPVGAAPVTYTVGGKQYVSVAVGGQEHNDVSRPFGLTDPRRLRNDSIYTFALP